MPTNQGVHALDLYAMMDTKIISSGACSIHPSVVHHILVKFMVLLDNLNGLVSWS